MRPTVSVLLSVLCDVCNKKIMLQYACCTVSTGGHRCLFGALTRGLSLITLILSYIRQEILCTEHPYTAAELALDTFWCLVQPPGGHHIL